MSKADDALTIASRELGKPYVWGAEGPNAFDCSGLMQYVMAQVGINLPRTAAEQQRVTNRVDNPYPGDLVFYGSPATHVGLYIGAGRMIHAPNSRSVVKVDQVYGSPEYRRVTGLEPGIGIPGIGSIPNPLDGLSGALDSWATSVLGGARNVAIEGSVLVLGLALLGFGLWKAVQQPAIRKVLSS
jgi:hypothetical protein